MDSWVKLSYAQRLFIWLLGYSLLLVGCFTAFQYRREKDFKAAELNAQLQLINSYISQELEAGVAPDSIPLNRTGYFEDIRVSIINHQGDVVYDNSFDRLPFTNHLNRKEIVEARKFGKGFTQRRHSESTGDTYFYSATLTGDGQIIRTAVPYSVSLNHLLEADYTFLWIMCGIALVFCLLGFLATRRVGLHIARLNLFAASAERGESITDTEPFPHDELGDISNHIVKLYARLQKAIADCEREHASAMHQQQEKERIKKQLTNNINHELKTPVASIQVCLETMLAHEDMSAAKRHEFLERSLAHPDRLKRLLSDVSLITRMDDGGLVINREPLNLTDLISSVVRDCNPLAKRKGISIANDICAKITVNGNELFLRSIFQNLIENAVSYSGGTCISLKIDSIDEKRVVILVADNGCGVSEEHLSHIFERFYRIDKGRSRASGGTGLGLAIVKNAVHLHDGKISVANQVSGGLVFTIVFPLNNPG